MYQGSSSIRDSLTKRGDAMEKVKGGEMMEAYTLGSTIMTRGQKAVSMSCNQIAHTH